MKILFAHFTTHWVNTSGGIEKVTCDFANEMCKRGHEVTILYIDSVEGKPYFTLGKDIITHNILFNNGKKIISEKLPVTIRAYREITRVFSQKKAQEVNARYKGKLYGVQIENYLKRNEFDVVVSCSEQSAKYLLTDAHCDLPVIEMTHINPILEFPRLSNLEKEAISRCKILQILVPSGMAVAKQYFPNLPIVVIGNVVMSAVKLANPSLSKNKYIISCVGNLSSRKNQMFLVKVFEKIAPKYKNWRLEIWGDYNNHFGKKLKEYIKLKKIDNVVMMKGKTTHIEDVYAQSDIYAFPSLSEGWGMSVTEAMAAGLPVVGLKSCAGVSDLVQHNKTGFLTENTQADFLNALTTLMDNPILREKMGKAGMASIKKFSPQIIWDKWEGILCQVAKGNLKV